MLAGAETPKGSFELAVEAVRRRSSAACGRSFDLPLSAWVISTVLHSPASIAAAAWRTCSMNEQPPTEVPSTQVGVMPR